jgi:delta 1-pyrroline-5-carboxylate dehydrogenase
MNQAAAIAEFAGLSPAIKAFIAKPKKLFIDGRWVEAASGKTFSTIDPASEQVICEVAEGDREDVDRAAKAAHKAFYEGEWSRTIPAVREALLLKWADRWKPMPIRWRNSNRWITASWSHTRK